MHNVSIIKRYHVREIARLTDTVGGTLHKELARLADAGLLLRNNIGITESAIANTERALFDTLPGEHQNDYYDMKITLRSNRKQEASSNESLTDQTKED